MKKTIIPIIIIVMIAALSGCGNQVSDPGDAVKYEGDKYVAVEYPANVFYYDYNGSTNDNFEEVDGIYPIESSKWKMIWNGGDLYCIEERAAEAEEYYADDGNYVWYYLVDSDEDEVNALPVTVTDSELEAIYDIENKEKELTVYFEEFETLGSLFKISTDGIVRGTLSIGKYNGAWYWRSEIIDDSQEREGTWPEYVQPLPGSLSDKILEAE